MPEEKTGKHQEALEDSEILLEAASPEIYRINAFRILEIPVDASLRDINLQIQKLEFLEKRRSGERQAGGALPLNPASDMDAIREASGRLREPERRLVDEFFWFWPHELGRGKADEALVALARNDIRAATAAWTKLENYQSEANVSKHNLAVLSHAMVLDTEHGTVGRGLSDQEKKNLEFFWQEAFKRWKVLIDHEGFWSRLTARIRDLNDPRLTTGTARRFRQTLPLALLLINAQLALRYAEKGKAKEVKRLLTVMNGWGDPDLSQEALRRAVKPLYGRIKIMCKTSDEQSDLHPEQGDQLSRRLQEQVRPLLKIIDSLLPAGNALRDSIHDEAAQRCLQCAISFGNKTNQWDKMADVIQDLPSLAATEAIRNRIEENIRIARNNRLYGRCFFCEENPPEDSSALEFKMHGNVQRTPTWQGTRTTWQHFTIEVPRCPSCKSAHRKHGGCGAAGAIIGALLGLGGFIAITSSDEDAWWVGLLVCGVVTAIFGGIGRAIGRIFLKKGVKPEAAKKDFPPIKEHLAKGWNFGDKPSDT